MKKSILEPYYKDILEFKKIYSYKKISEYIYNIYNIKVSPSTIQRFVIRKKTINSNKVFKRLNIYDYKYIEIYSSKKLK